MWDSRIAFFLKAMLVVCGSILHVLFILFIFFFFFPPCFKTLFAPFFLKMSDDVSSPNVITIIHVLHTLCTIPGLYFPHSLQHRTGQLWQHSHLPKRHTSHQQQHIFFRHQNIPIKIMSSTTNMAIQYEGHSIHASSGL